MFVDTSADTGSPLPLRANSRGRLRRPATKSLEIALGNKADRCFVDFLKVGAIIVHWPLLRKTRMFLRLMYSFWKCLIPVQRCLRWDPALRMTPEEALQHEWLRQDAVDAGRPMPIARRAPAGPRATGPLGAALKALGA